MPEAAALRVGQLVAWMQHNIGGHLHGIIPAKILEIDEGQGTIRVAEAVVKPEIRRNEAASFLREFSGKIKPPGGQPHPRFVERVPACGIKGFIKKIR